MVEPFDTLQQHGYFELANNFVVVSLWWVGWGCWQRAIFNYVNWQRIFFLVNSLFFPPIQSPSKQWICTFPALIANCTSYAVPPQLRLRVFGWLLCFIANWQLPKAIAYCIFLILLSANFMAKKYVTTSSHTFRPSHVSSPIPPPPRTLLFGWLLRVVVKWLPFNAEAPSLSLFCDGLCFSTPKKGKKSGKCKPTTGKLQQTYGVPWSQDLGAPLPYPWRDRATPQEGRVATHFDCCLLCCVVFVLRAPFCYLSYNTGRESTSAKAKWPTFVQSKHNICTQKPQILIGRQNFHHL